MYVKNYMVTEYELNKQVILKFEGSYMHTFVYVNGQLAGKNHFGYTTFYVPIHDFIKIGDNEIRVQVRNGAMSNSRWYSGGGLYRDVYLLKESQLHFEPKGSMVKTLDITDGNVLIEVSIPVTNNTSSVQKFIVETIIRDGKGNQVQLGKNPYFFESR